MAPRRYGPSRLSALRAPSGSGRGVQKRKKTIKEDGHLGRGRKNTWSQPWLKRLAVLRLCGLHFSEIFEVLGVLSRNLTPKVERTAQHNMKELFGTGWKDLCATDNDTLKRRLRFLLASEHIRTSHKRNHVSSSKSASRSDETTSSTSARKSCISFQGSSSELTREPLPSLEGSIADLTRQSTVSSYQSYPELLFQHSGTSTTTTNFTDPSPDGSSSAVIGFDDVSPFDCSSLLAHEHASEITYTPLEEQRPVTSLDRTQQTQIIQEIIFSRRMEETPSTALSNEDIQNHLSDSSSHSTDISFPSNSDRTLDDPIEAMADQQLAWHKGSEKSSWISRSSQMSKISGILKGYGRTSADRFLIKSVLSLRYSLSSLGTSIRESLSDASFVSRENNRTSFTQPLENEDVNSPSHPTAASLTEQQERIRSQNRLLLEICCSQDLNCVHRQITNCVNIPSARLDNLQSLSTEKLDQFGRNALFFAASVGAPLHVLLTLIRHFCMVINTRDVDNRSFMFYLDPRGLTRRECGCEFDLHDTAFQCLMMNLYHSGFDFGHVDCESKTFLDLLCLSEYFQIAWLVGLMSSNADMNGIVKRMASAHDCDGLSFTDRLSTEDLKTFLRCYTTAELSQLASSLEDRTQMHELMSDLTNRSFTDENLLPLVRDLYKQGADLDRHLIFGTTPLIFAAKQCCLETIRFLLSTGVDIHTRDSSGRTAVDYAMANFNSSRNAKTPTPFLAQALVAMLQFSGSKAKPLSIRSFLPSAMRKTAS
ncbi:unnamed protein product [Periconia digitata]|uniref:Uncharacterized protein n=1 Tax=Periconia digitata TaxID=1303443 RepID=A0A9W4UPS7_9PLEO|nr:unnamed protein product [Periconia digitata]